MADPALDHSNESPTLSLWLLWSILPLMLLGTVLPPWLAWGFNFWSLLPAGLAYGILIAVLILLQPPLSLRITGRLHPLLEWSDNMCTRLGTFVKVMVGSVLLFALFYLFRSQALIYGDGFMVLESYTNVSLPFDLSLYFMKPLVVISHRIAYSILSQIIPASPEAIIGMINAAGGILGFWALTRLSRLLTEDRRGARFVLVATLTSGALILFFGHIENYTWATALSLWTLAAAFGYVQGRNKAGRIILLALLALGFHLFTLPFLIVGLLAILGGSKERLPLGLSLRALNWIAVGASVIFALIVQSASQSVLTVPLWPQPDNPYWVFSPRHFLDLLNEIILVAPLALPVLLAALLRRRGKQAERTYPEQLLASAALYCLLLTFWLNPHLGAPRDWDFLSFFAFPLSLWAALQLRRWWPQHLSPLRLTAPAVIVLAVVIVPNIMEKNDLDLAVARLDNALADDPHYQPEYRQAERCMPWGYTLLYNVENDDRAEKYFHRRIAAKSESYQAYYNLGHIHSLRGDLDSAYVYLSRSAEIEPNDPGLLTRLAEVELRTGRYQEAVRHARLADRLAPDDLTVQNGLAIAFFQAGQYEKGLEHFHKAHRLAPDAADLLIDLGLAFGHLQIYDSSYHYLTRGLGRPCSLEARITGLKSLFNAALALGKRAEAQQALSQLQQIAPGDPQLPNLQYRLSQMR